MSFFESVSTYKIMPCTTLSWWLLVPKAPEELGFAATRLMPLMEKEEQDDFSLHSPVAQGCVEELWWARQSSDTTVLNRLGWLAGFPGTGVERNSRLLTPYQNLHFCSLSVLRKAMRVLLWRSFSGWRGIHTHRGRTRSPGALEGIGGTLGPQMQGQCPMAQVVSRGVGCPGRHWLLLCWNIELNRSEEYIGNIGCSPRQVGWSSRRQSLQIPRKYIYKIPHGIHKTMFLRSLMCLSSPLVPFQLWVINTST